MVPRKVLKGTPNGEILLKYKSSSLAFINKFLVSLSTEVASGTIDVGYFIPKSIYAVENGGIAVFPSGEYVNLINGPGNIVEVLSTPIPMTAWQGANKTYVANVGMTGTVSTSNSSTCMWGWDAQVLPLTRFSGNQSLRLRLSFWSKAVAVVNNCVITWKIYEVS